MGAVLVLLFVMGGVGWVIHEHKKQRARRQDLFERLAGWLGGTAEPAQGRVRGALGGVTTELRFVTRGAGSSSESWTEVECRLPPGYPLSLHLRRHGWTDRGRIARGEMVDLILGDTRFDDLFLVEGAPAEVVRRLLGPEIRGYLLGHDRAELETEDGHLRLSVRGWLFDEPSARAACEQTARVAGHLRDATLALDDAAPVTAAAAPYRGIPDDAPVREARAARAAEVERLETRRRERREGDRVALIGICLLIVVMLVAAHAC